jgi:hypothetical protein
MVLRRVCRHLSCVIPFLFASLQTSQLLADEPAPAAAASAAAARDGVPAAAAEPATLEPAGVPAKGRAQSLLKVSRPGRYSLSVKSESGTALQLVDRMGGPGAFFGAAGEADGRIDVFLEPGEYLVRTWGDKLAKGQAALSVAAFKPLVQSELRLPFLREVEAELGDLEERSYWFQLDKPTLFVLEAAGRHLADVSLWRDGGWLVDAAVNTSEIEPRMGRPLRLQQIETGLEPGLYRISFAGGPGTSWSDDDGSRPLAIRWGLETAGEAGRGQYQLGLFGYVRLLMQRSTSYLRLELPGGALPAGQSLRLEYLDWEKGQTFAEPDSYSELTKESTIPVLETYLDAQERGFRLVTISGATGEKFTFQYFNNERVRTFNKDGRFWLATLHAGDAADRLDATAIFTRRERRWTSTPVPLEAASADVVQLGPGVVKQRKVSIGGTSEVFFKVAALGEYEFSMPKTALRVMPFLPTWQYSAASPPFGDKANAPFKEGTARYQLDPGYYVLQLEPREEDVALLTMRSTAGPAKPAITAPHGMAVLGEQTLEARYDNTVFINAEPGVEAGLVLRPLPVEVTWPLPLEATEKPVTVPVEVLHRGLLRARAEDETIQLSLTVGGQVYPGSAWLDAGTYQVGVSRLDGLAQPVSASLYFLSADRVEEEPLPTLPADALAKLPIYPLLDDRAERFFDLDKNGMRTFLVHAEEPALYRLESSGLLATFGSLRTSLRPRLDASQDGGSGRNFLLQQFLGPGDYQLSVKALGESAGHLGVKLSRSPVKDGGLLGPGLAARADLPAGEAIAYRLKVPAAGTYRVRALGLGRPFRVRLDDKDGWPLVQPGSAGDLQLELAAGEYRLIVLPQAVDGRVVTRFDVFPSAGERQGHGPFPLPFGVTLAHRWIESPEGETRRPDVFTFSLPAEAELEVELDAEMRAEIFRRGDSVKVADVPPARRFSGRLAAGDYELRVYCSRRNNRVDYRLRIDTAQLLAGQSRKIEVPSSIELSLGAGSRLAEISSFGQVDVRARLYDAEGREVARFDDRPGDWNFSFSGRLSGRHRLQVDPVSAAGETEVLLRTREEQKDAAAAFPLSRKLKLEGDVHVLPLELPANAEVLAVTASAPGGVRLAVEMEAAGNGGAVSEVASAEGAAPRLLYWLEPGPAAYWLRVESLAHGAVEVNLQGAAVPLGAASEKALAAGVKPKSLAGLPADFGILAASFDRPGCFVLAGGVPRQVAGSSGWMASPLEAGQKVLGAPAGKLLLEADPRSALRLERWHLADGDSTFFLPPQGRAICDLPAAKGDGLRLLRASALAGQPSLAPGEESAMVQAVGPGSASTLLPRSAASVALYGEGGAPLRLSSRNFAAPAEAAVEAGGREGELAAGGSLAWRLPAGGKSLRLLLDRGLVASLEGGGEKRRLWSAEEEAVDVTLTGAFERLVVVNPGGGAGRVALELSPGEAKATAPALGQPWEKRLARAGTFELLVGGSGVGNNLHVRGAERSLLLGADGSVAEGEDLLLPPGGGRLLIDGEPGLLWVWVEPAGGQGLAGLWLENLPAGGTQPALPATLELGAGVEVFDFAFERPTVVHLRGDGAGVVAAELAAGQPLQVSSHAEAISADVYLPNGKGRVAVRPAGGVGGGLLELRSSPVAAAGEGLGPPFLLGPGQSRYVAFNVTAAGKIGWAARAESGVVEGRLLAADGRQLAEGGAGFADLLAGDYLLGLSVPADARPTRVRTALVGLVPRNDLPPQELIAKYAAGEVPLPAEVLAQEEAEREAAAEAAAAESESTESESSPREVREEPEACEGEDCGGEEEYSEEEMAEEGGGEEGGGL